MRDLFVPIQALDVICAGGRASESRGVRNVVQVGNVQLVVIMSSNIHCSDMYKGALYLALGTTGGQQVGVFGVELESLDSP